MTRFITIATAAATLVGAATGIVIALDRLGYFDDEAAAEAGEGEEPIVDELTLQITELTAQVNPQGFTGDCPVTFEFLGRITTGGEEGTVTYRWLRSDGGEGPKLTLDVDGPGTHEVENSWTLGSPGWEDDGQYWQELEILDPAPRTSGKAEFALRCPK